MQLNFEKIANHLRTCANCGRGTFIRTSAIDLYCSKCWSGLLANAKVSCSHDYPFQNYSLFTWTHDTPEVENLIYSLKGARLPGAFQKLAEHFAFGFCRAGLSHKLAVKRTQFVIPPSLRPSHHDHAQAWANALSSILGFPVSAPFEFATENSASERSAKPNLLDALTPQKRKSAKDRFRRQFKLKPGIRVKGARIVFVDDLVTSGATALAAYKALNSPVDFEVWTIARRPKLAGN